MANMQKDYEKEIEIKELIIANLERKIDEL